jgi:hypothetical protein
MNCSSLAVIEYSTLSSALLPETINSHQVRCYNVDGRGILEGSEEKQESKEDLVNDKWVEDNFEDLIQQYPRRWIAVMDQKVVASGGIRYFLERKVKKMVKDKDYSIYFVPPTSTRTDVTYENH